MLHTSPYKNEFTKIGDVGLDIYFFYPHKNENLKLSASMPPYNFNNDESCNHYIRICTCTCIYI